MKLSPLTQIKLVAVLATAGALLGCEAPSSSAGEQAPPVSAANPSLSQPDLVTATTNPPVALPTPALAAETPTTEPANPEPVRPPVTLPDRLQEVVKLAQSGVGDAVILAFIENSAAPFNPTPDQILYLTDLGISDVIITALVNHGAAQPPPPVAVQTAPVMQQPLPLPEGQPPADAATYNPEPPMAYGSQPVEQYVTPPPPVEEDYFYSSLAPYGSWVDVPDYGVCWQPTVAVIQADWRPYCQRGHWLYTDCGYYWQSDYSWGWAPFHYGRWFHHPGHGWCWRPGSVWAPAWVSWRYTDSHCGWAPLPPGAHYRAGIGLTYYGAHVDAGFGFGLHRDAWTFVPAQRFHEHDVWRHRVAPTEQPHIYSRSKVANNYAVHNDVIVNRGVSDRVPTLARSEPRKVLVRDMPERTGANIRPDRLRQEGAEVVVYRPKLPTAQENFKSAEGRNVRNAAGAEHLVSVRQSVTPQVPLVEPGRARLPMPSATVDTRTEPSRSLSGERPEHNVRPAAPAPASARSTVRTEPARANPMPAERSAPAGQVSTPQTYRMPSPVNPRVAPVSPQNRQEIANPSPATSFSPQQVNRPNPPAATTAESRPAPTWSPVQSQPSRTYGRPATQAEQTPAYTPPAVQTRPAQSYSPPATRSQPAPSYAPPAMQTRPAPSYSPPAAAAPPRPAPTYSPPAVQTRPAQPAARSVQSAPAQGASGSRNGRPY